VVCGAPVGGGGGAGLRFIMYHPIATIAITTTTIIAIAVGSGISFDLPILVLLSQR
jgi:Sec-independent protein secretion pathway component TatC